MPVTTLFDPRFEQYPADRLNPDPGWERDHKPRVLKASFGDGYGQRAGDGQNSDPLTLSLKWTNVTKIEADYMETFLEAQRGYKSFLWTLPDETAARAWVCEDFKVEQVAFNVYTVSATFQQVYDI